MVMARLHIICGNCGDATSFTYKTQDNEEGEWVYLLCNNCGTLHNLEDNAKQEDE